MKRFKVKISDQNGQLLMEIENATETDVSFIQATAKNTVKVEAIEQ